uniref:Secreted protein n=1 Tax=Setaria digitata TaxID=48799 RepID=A0A915PJ00_9BILA
MLATVVAIAILILITIIIITNHYYRLVACCSQLHAHKTNTPPCACVRVCIHTLSMRTYRLCSPIHLRTCAWVGVAEWCNARRASVDVSFDLIRQ